jgi:hypothetical protein
MATIAVVVPSNNDRTDILAIVVVEFESFVLAFNGTGSSTSPSTSTGLFLSSSP